MNLNYPAPSSVWETDYSLKPTLPCKCHRFSISSRRKCFAERAANGGAVMDMGAHIQMSMARTTVFLWQGAYSVVAVGLARICELLDVGKILPRWAGKGTHCTVYAWLVKGSEFPLEDLPGSATETRCPTSTSGGQEEMVLKLFRNAPRYGIQNENASGFLGRSKSIQANLTSI